MIGMEHVASQLEDLIAHQEEIAEMKAAGMKIPPQESPNLLMVGPPGTGKSTVAEALGEAYSLLGVTKSNKVVSKHPSELVGTAVGDSQENTLKALKDADQGVLVIDEAHQLMKSPYGRAVLDTLMVPMADKSNKTVVVFAGYPEHIDKLLEHDPGLKSRFPDRLEFNSFSPDDLSEITRRNVAAHGNVQDEDAEVAMDEAMDLIASTPGNANVRDANNMLAYANKARRQRSTKSTPLKERLVLNEGDWIAAQELYKLQMKKRGTADMTL